MAFRRNMLLLALIGGLIFTSGCGGGSIKKAGSNSSEPAAASDTQLDLTAVPVNNVDITPAMLKASITSQGNLARLAKVIDKAERGEDIVIGTFGGSITEGMSASPAGNSYSMTLARWFRETFSGCKVSLTNAGIGATGSLIGVHRIKEDLLDKNPDLIIFEFSCNDTPSELEQETYESAVRRILMQSNEPAVMLLFMTRKDGTNSQAVEIPIGLKYRLPMISYGDAVKKAIQDKNLTWEDLSPDVVHPNNRGHKIAADLLIHRIQAVMRYRGQISRDVPALPDSDVRFMNAVLQNNQTLTAKTMSGFTAQNALYPNASLGNGWVAEKTGSVLTFESESQVISLVFKRMVLQRGATAQVSINGEAVALLKSDFKGGFGEYADVKTILNRRGTTKVTIEIKLIEEAGIPADSKFLLLAVLES